MTLGFPIWPSDLLGAWTLAVDPEAAGDGYKETRQLGSRWKRVVGVGGVIVPLPTGKSTVGNPDLKLPIITRCEELTLTRQEDMIRLDCGSLGTYDYRVGDYRGRVTTLKKRKLTERYSSTNRGVFTEYRLTKEGLMEVRVVLRMGRVKSEYKRVFGPKTNTDEQTDKPAS